ncbi:hypothetical protein [Streptomyces sp. NPDC052225]|uniref:hypothetical protein n=1 Tax=Streptomyces sp. NPDC052225 TaxID=3154949 RepID=UPI0034364239
MNSRGIRRAAVGALTVLALAGASPAFALSASKGGARAWTESSATIMNLQDTQDDGHDVKVNYYRTAHPSDQLTLWNKQAYGDTYFEDNDGNSWTVESGKYSTIFKMQACEVYNNFPDDCTGW